MAYQTASFSYKEHLMRKLRMVLMLLAAVLALTFFTFPSTAHAAKISKRFATISVGKTVKLKVRGGRGKVRWYTSNKQIATVSQKGKVKGKRPGTATITAVRRGRRYTSKITVFGITKSTKTMTKGSKFTFKANLKGTKWTSSNKKVIKISKSGIAVAKKTGKAKLTVKKGKYKVSVTVKVVKQQTRPAASQRSTTPSVSSRPVNHTTASTSNPTSSHSSQTWTSASGTSKTPESSTSSSTGSTSGGSSGNASSGGSSSSKYDTNTGHPLSYYEAMIKDGVPLAYDQLLEYQKLLETKVYTMDELPELEAQAKNGGLTAHQWSELQRLRKEKKDAEEKPYRDLIASYVQPCRDYDKTILMQYEYGHKSELEVLKGYMDYMSKSFYYSNGGNECQMFSYPNLWQKLQEGGYVAKKHFGVGWTCNGAAGRLSSIAVYYYHSQTRIISMPEYSGGNNSHVAVAILLPDGWYVFSPGYKSNNSSSYNPGHCDGPCTINSVDDPQTFNYKTVYNRIVSMNYPGCINTLDWPYNTK